MKKLIVLAAPSGGGKTTLCQRLLQDFPQLSLSISSTTRAPRGQEQEGRDYFFLSHDQFKKEIDQDLFAEWALVHGNYYGTSKKTLESAFAAGKSVLLDIDVQGAASIKKAYPKDTLLLFVTPPSLEILEQRLRTRGTESEVAIQKRLSHARVELAQAPLFDHQIINDDLNRAYSELKGIVST